MADRQMVVFPATHDDRTALLHDRGLVTRDRLQTVIQEQRRQFPLLDYAQDLVAVCDFNGFLVDLNPIGRQLMGVDPAEDLSLFQVRCFTPLTQDLWDEIFTSLVNEGLWSGDHMLQYAADPVVVKLLVMAHRVPGAAPEAIDCFSIVARVQTPPPERGCPSPIVTSPAIPERDRDFHQMITNMNEILYEIDQSGNFSYVSPQIESVLGFSPAECLGRSPLDFTHPEDQAIIQDRIPRLLATGIGGHSEVRSRHAAGHYIWLSISDGIHRSATGEILAIQGSLRNIDHQKSIEAALQSKTEYLQQALNHLQQARTRMVQAEKMSSLGQLVAGIAHEINNPVNFIHGNLKYATDYIDDLLGLLNQYRRAYPEPPALIQATIDVIDLDYLFQDLPRLFSSMAVGADRIREIVLSLRNFARLDEVGRKDANLHEGIESTLMILASRLKSPTDCPEVQVICEFGDLPLVSCFAGAVNQVFMNLLVNAIEALEAAYGRGEVAVPTIVIQTAIVDGQAHLRFIDNGPGIPAAVQSRLFDPFFTTKAVGQGTGMGLAISYQVICEQHQGELTVRSQPGAGTCFEIRLPLHLAAAGDAV
jgi:two-component system, NtrC family, sensor kinase